MNDFKGHEMNYFGFKGTKKRNISYGLVKWARNWVGL